MPAKGPAPAAAPRAGLTKVTLGYGHLLKTLPSPTLPNTVNGKSDAKRKPSPAIDAPPESSSDDASLVDDEELVDITSPPEAKRRQSPTIRAPRNGNGEAPTSPDTASGAISSYMEPSRIPHTTFASLKRKSARGYESEAHPKTTEEDIKLGIKDNIDDPFSVFQSSPKIKRFQSTYAKTSNIHGSIAAQREKKPIKKSTAVVKEGAGGFKKADRGVLDSLIDKHDQANADGAFKDPNSLYDIGKHTTKNNRRTSRNSQSTLQDTPTFKIPKILPSPQRESPRKRSGFIAPPSIPGERRSPRKIRSSNAFKNPLDTELTGFLSSNVLGGFLEKDAFKTLQDLQLPPSSVTASSLQSTSNEAASSVSSLSSPPESPILDASIEHQAFSTFNIPEYHNHSEAKCPVCRKTVDRDFLESFNNGSRLNVRQQGQFCRAHQKRAAVAEWEERGYPKIDWDRFGKRLKKHHHVIDDILTGLRQSFYRNALDDLVKSGRNRTLAQKMMSGESIEALSPGYYGTRGARAMEDNIIENFSPTLRRLAASDKLISSGGVSDYVQAVLVPELAVMLVKEDMGIDDDERAREILRESVEIGDLLNEEEDEVVHLPDRDEDEEDEDM
ncbi:Restriction of telomere capping protein 4, C-terminal [Lasallia pustulata]|uniref:Restriction of telomere capping protein 4 n=1 Tax=Lasallia pustulata TaxID=136370 RepID=A0A1W5DB52_9LECA|nr:Restriction of telomere capping protein 4, C-terminal [Lasallia pustulata]